MDEIFEKAIAETMTWVVDTVLIPHFMSLGLNATGEWVANVGTRVEKNKRIISGRKYSEQLVWGRNPGKPPPISPLIRWAEVKLGLSGQHAVSAAFAISNKIASEGTEIFKQGGTDLLEILEAPETVSKITKHLADSVTADVQLFLEREIVKAW
jgi:hypothetical protein